MNEFIHAFFIPLYNPVIGSLPSSLAVAATHQIGLNPDSIFKTSPQISQNQWGKSVSILWRTFVVSVPCNCTSNGGISPLTFWGPLYMYLTLVYRRQILTPKVDSRTERFIMAVDP